MSELTVDLQRAIEAPGVPEDFEFERWAQAAWLDEHSSEVTIRIVASDESADLNSQYRGDRKSVV